MPTICHRILALACFVHLAAGCDDAEAPALRFATATAACDALADAWCSWAATCGASSSKATCRDTMQVGIQRQLCFDTAVPVWAARDAETLVLDLAALGKCLDAQAAGCGLAPEIGRCTSAAATGRQALAAACSLDAECAAGGYCHKANSSACGGTCTARAALGQACASPSACATGLQCNASGVCAAAAKAGETCPPGCGEGLVCDLTCKPIAEVLGACTQKTGAPCGWTGIFACASDNTNGTRCWSVVTGFGALGAACSAATVDLSLPANAAQYPASCALGLRCQGAKCVQPLAIGAACDPAVDACEPTGTCDATTLTCRGRPGVGEPCVATSIGFCAAPSLCGSGMTCINLKALGAPCGQDGDCATAKCTQGLCAIGCG